MSSDRPALHRLAERLVQEQDELLARHPGASTFRAPRRRSREQRWTLDAVVLGDDPSARWWRRARVLAGVAVVVAAMLVWQSARGHRAGACAQASPLAVWDDHVKARVQSAFAATGLSYAADTYRRVASMLDRYAAVLTATRTGACEATRVRGEQSSQLLDLRMQCLDRRAGQLSALAALFAEPLQPAVVERAVEAASGLDDIAACSDVAALRAAAPLPGDPAVRARVAALQRRIDEARSLERAGLYRRGLDVATQIVADAQALGDAPIEAEATLLLAVLQRNVSDYPSAEASLREAARAAARARDDTRTAIALMDLFELVGHLMGRHAEGMALRDAAEIAVLRAGDAPALRARLLSREAEVLQEAGRREEALLAAERAVSLRETSGAADDLERVHAYLSYARILGGLERWEEAQRAAERALQIDEALLGPEHPEVGRSCKYIGDFLMMRGRYVEARPYYERAIAIAESSVGHQSNDIRGAYNGVASVLQHTGQLDEALRYFREALAIEERLSGPDSSSGHAIRLNMGETLRALGRPAEARQMCERARSSLEAGLAVGRGNPVNLPAALDCLGRLLADQRRYAPAIALFQRALTMYTGGNLDRPTHAATLVHLAQAYLATGRAADALPPLVRAAQVFDAQECDAGDAGDAHFALAQALWSANDRSGAVVRAEQALSDYARAGSMRETERAAVVAWLARRR